MSGIMLKMGVECLYVAQPAYAGLFQLLFAQICFGISMSMFPDQNPITFVCCGWRIGGQFEKALPHMILMVRSTIQFYRDYVNELRGFITIYVEEEE